MNKTIAVIGSSRRNGNTGQLLDSIANELGIEVIDLSTKNISPFDYEHKNIDDDFLPLMNHLLKHDNIIFASPVYWYSMSAQMKVFIDRTSDLLDVEELNDQGRELRSKVGYVVCTSITASVDDSFINSFTDTFRYLGMGVGAYIHVDCKDDYNRNSCQDDIIDFIKKLKSGTQ